MGLYDEIRWDAPLPEGHPPDDRIFQTKSLDPCLGHFRVTPEGRLELVRNGWDDDDLEVAENLEGVGVEFHGDMRLVARKTYRQYLARFTHGVLEWIRPLADDEPYDPVALARMKLDSASSASPAAETPTQDAAGEAKEP
jgi:hypothetical protein